MCGTFEPRRADTNKDMKANIHGGWESSQMHAGPNLLKLQHTSKLWDMRHALTRIYNDAVLGHYNNNAITDFLPEVVYQFPSFSAGYYVVSEDDFMESYPCQP